MQPLSIQKMYDMLSKTPETNDISRYRFIEQSRFNIILSTLHNPLALQLNNTGAIEYDDTKNRVITTANIASKNIELEPLLLRYSPEGDITTRVQSIDIPEIAIPPDILQTFAVGTTPIGNTTGWRTGSTNEITLSVLSTEDLFIEQFFGVWLEDTTCTRWKYKEIPFNKGRLSVSIYQSEINAAMHSRSILTFNFIGVYPTGIDTPTMSHTYTFKPTRDVTLAYEYMTIDCTPSNAKSVEGVSSTASTPASTRGQVTDAVVGNFTGSSRGQSQVV